MTTSEYKAIVEKEIGIPAALLNGTTAKSILTQARALREYKLAAVPQPPKSPKDQFREYIGKIFGFENTQDNTELALEELADQIDSLY